MLTAVCTALLLIGCLGLLITLLLGGHAGHHNGHAHIGHRAHPASQGAGGSRLSLLLTIFSPIILFSLCAGAGASGLLANHFRLSTTIVVLCAIGGGLGCYALFVRPLIAVLMNFASTPSKALDGSIAEPAEVVSRFDSSGKGVVKLTVDGQVVRVLATLEDSDLATAAEIAPGDRLIVTNVNTRTNACRVSRI